MIALGAGSPMEAWDPALKSNTTFSHPWAASPAYLVYRGTFGIQALEPGYKRFEVRPQPGGLTRAEAVVPTVRGQIPAAFATADAGKLDMVVGVPANTSAHVAVPKPTDGSTTLYVDRVAQEGTVDGNFLTVDVGSGCHIVSTTGAASLPANVLQVAKGCDTMPPAITVPADITAEATGPNGAVVSFTSATATDIVDGNVAVSCDHASGSTFPPGTTTVTCSATDAAGNTATASFKVIVVYKFAGFFQPVDNPPTVNKAKAGVAIPVKFSLNGNMGLNIFATGYPKVEQVNCSSGSVDDIEQTVTAGSSSLSYDPATDTYTYVWKTDSKWANTCWKLTVRLIDGTDHVAYFTFTK